LKRLKVNNLKLQITLTSFARNDTYTNLLFMKTSCDENPSPCYGNSLSCNGNPPPSHENQLPFMEIIFSLFLCFISSKIY
jgi:hypothetical protein